MRQVTCKKLGSVSSLTVGSTYEIITETADRFIVVNDKGVQSRYGKNLFHDPVEVPDAVEAAAPAEVPMRRRVGRPSRAEQAARAGMEVPAPVVVERPAPRVVGVLEVNTSAVNDDGEVKFIADFDFGNNAILHYDSNFIIFASDTSCSCGVKSITGLDSLRVSFEELRARFNAYIDQNRANFVLANDINVEEVFSGIASAWLQDLTAAFQGEEADMVAGVLLLSTTTQSINRTPLLRDALDEISSSNITVNNPNSGNEIVMWNIAVEA